MKITKSQLKQIIKEELKETLNEVTEETRDFVDPNVGDFGARGSGLDKGSFYSGIEGTDPRMHKLAKEIGQWLYEASMQNKDLIKIIETGEDQKTPKGKLPSQLSAGVHLRQYIAEVKKAVAIVNRKVQELDDTLPQ